MRNKIGKTMIILLSVFSLINQVHYVSADNHKNNEINNEWGTIEYTEIDSSTLNVPRLGEVVDSQGSVETHDDDELVRVSIFLKSPSGYEMGYAGKDIMSNRAILNFLIDKYNEQNNVIEEIQRTLHKQLNVIGRLSMIDNVISADIRYGDIKSISSIPEIECVELENMVYLCDENETDDASYRTAYSSDVMTGATYLWGQGYSGSGTRIAIVDTGIDAEHISFDNEAFMFSIRQIEEQTGQPVDLLTKEDVDSFKEPIGTDNKGNPVYLLSTGDTGVYINEKIPFGVSYPYGNEYYHTGTGYYADHGSMVAGIAAANKYIKVYDEEDADYVDVDEDGVVHYYANAATTVGAIGMAPDAQIIVMNVFSRSFSASEFDYMAAIDDAMKLGCDACDLSLGGKSAGSCLGERYQSILNNLMNPNHNYNQMILSISAGNNGFLNNCSEDDIPLNDVFVGTVSHPASYCNALAVAAAHVTYDYTIEDPVIRFDDGKIYARFIDSSDYYGAPSLYSLHGERQYIYIDGDISINDIETINNSVTIDGNILVFTTRDMITVDFLNSIVPYKPLAICYYFSMSAALELNLSGFNGSFPVVCVDDSFTRSFSNDDYITVDGIKYHVGTLVVPNYPVPSITDLGVENAGFTYYSSWGCSDSLLMKPDITAPTHAITVDGGTIDDHQHHKYSEGTGTSSSAPHSAGLSAIISEYVKKQGISIEGYGTRAIVQSLMMSTAVPMKNTSIDEYYPILQQGAGLINAKNAALSRTVIMMNTEEDTLTAYSCQARDGKVKVELGDDPDRVGQYTYSFRIYNISRGDNKGDVYFETPNTDVFTQGYYVLDDVYMSRNTIAAGTQLSYSWTPSRLLPDDPNVENLYDVNKDGRTDDADAVCILEYIAGNCFNSEIDINIADIDGDREITTKDANILLEYLSNHPFTYVPEDGYADVSITFSFNVDDLIYQDGAYIEGFTYLKEVDGISHSIPILGFYGNWSDHGREYTKTYLEDLYEGNNNFSGSYLELIYPDGKLAYFTGNPYKIEESIPYDCFSINSNTIIYSGKISGTNNIGGFYGSFIVDTDVDDNITNVYSSSYMSSIGYNNDWKKVPPSNQNLQDGHELFIGCCNVSEYYTILYHGKRYGDISSLMTTHLEQDLFEDLLLDNRLSKKMIFGYYMTVDDTSPCIDYILFSETTDQEKKLKAKVSDNANLAYVALMSPDGKKIYFEHVPHSQEYIFEEDITAIEENSCDLVLFVADYSGNEYSVILRNDFDGGNLAVLSTDENGYYLSSIDLNTKQICHDVILGGLPSDINVTSGFLMKDDGDVPSVYCFTDNAQMYGAEFDISSMHMCFCGDYDCGPIAVCDGLPDFSSKYGQFVGVEEKELDILCLETSYVLKPILLSDYLKNSLAIDIALTDICGVFSQQEQAFYILDSQGWVWMAVLYYDPPTGDYYEDASYISLVEMIRVYHMDFENHSFERDRIYYDNGILYYVYNELTKSEIYVIYIETNAVVKIGELFEDRTIVDIIFKDVSEDDNTINTSQQPYSNCVSNEIVALEQTNMIRKVNESTSNNDKRGTRIESGAFNDVIQTTEEYGDYVINISYDEEITNGLITIQYSPPHIILDSVFSNLKYKVINIDEESGTIQIVFANGIVIEPNEILATINFKTIPCVHNTINIVTSEKNNNVHMNDVLMVEIDATHDWEFAKIEWNTLNTTPKPYILYRCSQCGTYSGYIPMSVSVKQGPLWTDYIAYISAEDSWDGLAHTARKRIMNKIDPIIKPIVEKKEILDKPIAIRP